MTAGLQIWNSSGQIILDATQRCSRVIGIRTLTGGQSDSFSDSRLTAGTVFWAYQRDTSFHLSYGYGGIMSPSFSFSGDTLTWTYTAKQNNFDEYAAGTLIIGVY